MAINNGININHPRNLTKAVPGRVTHESGAAGLAFETWEFPVHPVRHERSLEQHGSLLALDAVGGTETDYLLADETSELARVRAGTIKRMRTDASTAAANLDQALAELTTLTGVGPRAIARTCIGTAGETARSSPTGSAKPSPPASPAASACSAM